MLHKVTFQSFALRPFFFFFLFSASNPVFAKTLTFGSFVLFPLKKYQNSPLTGEDGSVVRLFSANWLFTFMTLLYQWNCSASEREKCVDILRLHHARLSADFFPLTGCPPHHVKGFSAKWTEMQTLSFFFSAYCYYLL